MLVESSGYSTRVSDFGCERLGHRADEITVAELLEIKVVGCGRRPQPERIDGLAAVAHDRTIVWNADQTSTD